MRWIHRCICLVLGSLMGCSGDDPLLPEPEYGVPSAKLVIDGQVTLAGIAQPIPDIEVRLAGVDTVWTDAEGLWSMMHYGVDPATVALETLHFVDVDGVENFGFLEDVARPLDPANIVGGVYIDQDILVSMSEMAAEYGPPPATLKSGK